MFLCKYFRVKNTAMQIIIILMLSTIVYILLFRYIIHNIILFVIHKCIEIQ